MGLVSGFWGPVTATHQGAIYTLCFGVADSPMAEPQWDSSTTHCPCKLRCVHALIVALSICKDLPCAWKLASLGPDGLSLPPYSCLEWKEARQGGGLFPGWMGMEGWDSMWHCLRGEAPMGRDLWSGQLEGA